MQELSNEKKENSSVAYPRASDTTNGDSHTLSQAYRSPENYRIFSFTNNNKFFIQVDDAEYHLTHKRYFYDENWCFQKFSYNMPPLSDEIARPKPLEKILKIATLLTQGVDFVRVDLYELDSGIFVSELTLTPCGGSGKYTPTQWDTHLGALWEKSH